MKGESFERAQRDALGCRMVVELQSFRGIAALIVLIYHCALYFDYGAAPAHAMTFMLNAHAAVVSFFVLSGLVLTLSLMRGTLDAERIGFFYLRRAFRIYPALWIACALSVGCFVAFGAMVAPGGSRWAHDILGMWPVSKAKLALAFAGLKPFLPVPIWSLAIELIGSVAIPFIVLTMRRSGWVFAGLAIGLAILSTFGLDRLVLTPTYMVAFAFGAGIALAAPAWRQAATSSWVVAAGAIGGFAMMWFARNLTGADFHDHYHQGWATLWESIGATLLIGTIYVRPDCFPVLAARWAKSLGDMSYSLYLLHVPIVGLLCVLAGRMAPDVVAAYPGLATIVLVVLTLAVTLPLSDWCFRHVELPAIGAGQRAVRAIERRVHPQSRTRMPVGLPARR